MTDSKGIRKVAYFNPVCGISGDMCLGALIAAGLDRNKLVAGLELLGLDGWKVNEREVRKGGISAIYAGIETKEEGSHRSMDDIANIIEGSKLPSEVKTNAFEIFRTLGEAEARVHGTSLDEIHFHEVGALDSIIDIVGFAIGIDSLGIDDIHCGTISLGGGTVECAHGILPVPAPAAAIMLKGLPSRGGPVESEIATPTGVAIMKTLAARFGPMPPMKMTSVGYGAGSKDFGIPNVLQVVIGEMESCTVVREMISIIETNIDDMTGEDIGWLREKLFEIDVRECYVTPIQMKKNRPGVHLTIMCEPVNTQKVIDYLLRNSTTRGVRFRTEERVRLDERIIERETVHGKVRFKENIGADGEVIKTKPEHDDLKRIADEKGMPIHEVRRDVLGKGGG